MWARKGLSVCVCAALLRRGSCSVGSAFRNAILLPDCFVSFVGKRQDIKETIEDASPLSHDAPPHTSVCFFLFSLCFRTEHCFFYFLIPRVREGEAKSPQWRTSP